MPRTSSATQSIPRLSVITAFVLFLGVLLLLLAAPLYAEPITEPVAARYYEIGAMPGGAPGACTIIYYNLCSGWMLGQPDLPISSRIGVVYDLAAECAGGEEHECENVMNYWYWGVMGGGYFGPRVMYALWEVDEDNCFAFNQGGSVATTPMSGWNAIPGLGPAPGSRVALVASKTSNFVLRPHTDNNVKNASGGPACAGAGVGNGSSVQYGVPVYDCPPTPYTDALGPVNLLVRSVWNCPTATGVAGPQPATESSSWTDLKRLFQ